MKKRTGILLAMAIFMGIPFVVKASEVSGFDDTLKSYGSIFYEDATGSVKIYAEDIALLQEKLDSIPDEIFDPILYSHNHVWEYINITDQSHTEHCNGCGSKYDLTNPHIVVETETCTISFHGQEFPGYEMSCECGYKWKEEMDHIPIYTPKDETYHTISCALGGMSYCKGMESSDMEHGMVPQPTDATHHQNVCGVCEYKGDVEECVFDILDIDDAVGDNLEERKYCECGNFIIESQAGVTDSIMTGLKTADTEDETEEEQSEFEEDGKTKKKLPLSDLNELPAISVSGNDCTENKEGE